MGNQYSYQGTEGEADGFPDDVGSEPPELPAPPPPPVAAAASAPQPVPAPVVAAGGDSGSGAAAAAAVAAAAAAAQQLQQQQQAPSVGSAPEQSHPSSVARPGSVHTRTLSFDAGEGERESPVYKLARLSLRAAAEDQEDDTLEAIGDSPRSDISSSSAGGFGETAQERAARAADLEPKTVPMVISWRHPGINVLLTGDFNAWQQDHPMQRDGNEFWSVIDLLPGTYHYKFVVDGEWMYAPDHLTARDARGNMSNYITVEPYESTIEAEIAEPESPRASYAQHVPVLEDQYTKEPPSVPSHLLARFELPQEQEQGGGRAFGTAGGAPVRSAEGAPGGGGGGGAGGVGGPAIRPPMWGAARATVAKPPHVLLNHMYHAVGGRATEAASGAAAAGDAAATTAPKIMTVTTRYVDKGSGDKFVANVYYTR